MFNQKIAKKKFIIKSGDDAVSFFTKRNMILERAKQEGIITYILGANQDAIKNINEIEADSRSDLQIHIDILKVQIDEERKMIKKELFDRINVEPLYVYELIIVTAARYPTQNELITARQNVYLPERALKDLLRSKGKDIPTTVQQWESVAESLLPDNYYCPFKGTLDQRNESINTVWINPVTYYQLVELEAKRSSRVKRFQSRVDTTIPLVSAKLSNLSLIKARNDCQENKINLSKQIKRADDHNGKILQFFIDSVEGIALSEASDLIRNMQWSLILPKLTEVYTRQLTQQSSQVFLTMLMNLKLHDNQTLQHLYEQAKLMVANQLLEAKIRDDRINTYLNSEECKEMIDLTDAEFELKYPLTRTFIVSNAIVDCLINACSHEDSRFREATVKFRLEHDKKSQSTKQFFAAMVSEENIMPEIKKVRLNTYVAEANYIKPSITIKNKKDKKDTTINNENIKKLHCPYHSYNNTSNHNESDCYFLKKGLTKVDPANPKWHVLKTSGLHYGEQKKTVANNVSTTNTKVGPCTKCQNNNKTNKVVYSHNTADCTISGSDKPIEQSNKQIGSMISALQKSMKKITNHVESNTKKSSYKKRKRGKVSKPTNQDTSSESSDANSESS